MKIIADFTISEKYSPAVSAYIERLWFSLAELDPAQEFLFISGQPAVNGLSVPANVVVRHMRLNNFAWWRRRQLLKVINEWGANRYITVGQYALNIKAICQKPARSKDLQQPGIDVFFSETHRQLFKKGSKSNESHKSKGTHVSNESHVIPLAVEDPIPALSWADAESVKTQYTGGKDFFLFAGDMDEQHQLLELLKAFSLFKKWQQSNMQLVFAGYETNWAEVFEEKLASYKYRGDVVVLNDLPSAETARLIAASYAVVYPCTQAVLPLTIISAVQAGVAVIASDIPVNREATSAACWVDNSILQEGFAKAMMLLYKDESSKGDIIRQMKEGATSYTWQQMLAALQQIINKE